MLGQSAFRIAASTERRKSWGKSPLEHAFDSFSYGLQQKLAGLTATKSSALFPIQYTDACCVSWARNSYVCSTLQRFNKIADDALVKISEHLWTEAKLALVIYTPGKPEEEIVLKDIDLQEDEVVSTLRHRGLSIDGDNAYKRDLCDLISGAIALGYQGNNQPPADHCANRFWDIGRVEGVMREELTAALKLTRENLRACQATIHLAGGFDPAYVDDAQAAMKIADSVLAKYPPLNPA
jgi:hypothetical protein